MEDRRAERFTGVDLRGARFRDCDLRDIKVTDAMLIDADISGLIQGLRVNGVEVAPLVEAELDRRHPERVQLRAAKTPEAMRDAWTIIEDLWSATTERAQRLPEAALYERVDEEWSFVETLRHLIFATDAWVRRTILRDPHPYWSGELPHTSHDGVDLGIDLGAAPSFAEVLPVRLDRMECVRRIVDELTAEELARTCDQNPEPGYPEDTTVTVRQCLRTVLNEEWHHHQYASRDLEALEARR